MEQMSSTSERVDHLGNPLPADAYFFAPPPPEIGEVQSAYSTLKGADVQHIGQRRLIFTGISAAVTGAIVFSVLFFGMASKDPSGLVWVLLSAGLVGAIVYFSSARYNCSYVGSHGVARFFCGANPQQYRSEIFLFQTATELRTRCIHHYTNGIYTNTEYAFIWTDAHRKQVYALNGTHNSGTKTPKAPHPYNFGNAAEMAWTGFLLAAARTEFSVRGFIQFNLRGQDYVRVGDQYVELFQRGKVEQCPTDNIASFTISEGMWTVRLKDAKSGFLGIGSKGIFSFEYAGMANAQLFIIVLEKLAGLSFG
jgi:hypothetical protein